MRIVIFCHSLISDWNHGNAHFLRGVVSELQDRGHAVRVYEPDDAWSLQHLLSEHGPAAIDGFRRAYPHLHSTQYDLASLDLDEVLDDADLVLVHEWNDPGLVARIGEHRARTGGYRLLFHDTHHRSVSKPEEMNRYDLEHYDGVLAFGRTIRDRYLETGWADRAWVWHEAADTRVFYPRSNEPREGDLVWIGNWGDEERTEELHEFLLEPVRRLGLRAKVYGVRYPQHARRALAKMGIQYAGWLPNHQAPRIFARYRLTVHVPRRYYADTLPGIPTIRPFEALACGIPLVSAPWRDSERLFHPGDDYQIARDGQEMTEHLRRLLEHPDEAADQVAHGLSTIRRRHTCGHRARQLLAICRELGLDTTTANAPVNDPQPSARISAHG